MVPTTLLRRSSLCDSYTTTCSSYRTAVLVIIIATGFLTTSILLFYYLRKRAFILPKPRCSSLNLVHPHRLHKKMESNTWRRDGDDAGLELPRYEHEYDAPPPYVYMLARPERAHVHGVRT